MPGDIAVLMASYNADRTVRQAAESVLAGTVPCRLAWAGATVTLLLFAIPMKWVTALKVGMRPIKGTHSVTRR